jgi:hypothetical protein
VSRILFEGAVPRVPKGYVLVDTEVGFWRSALGADNLFIMGDAYGWAKTFFEARGLKYQVRRSPELEMVTLCPKLTAEQALVLYQKIGAETFENLPRPLELAVIAATFWRQDWMQNEVSPNHAARFASWRIEQPKLTEAEGILLEILANEWAESSQFVEKAAYRQTDLVAAFKALKDWLEQPQDWQAFPLEISPTLRQQLTTEYRTEALQAQGRLLEKLPKINKQIRPIVADACARYFEAHPERFKNEDFAQIKPYLQSQSQLQNLRDLLPVPIPTALPKNTAEWQSWFVNQYLPFRRKKAYQDSELRQVARDFAIRYLESYSHALAGSGDRQFLSFTKTQELPHFERVVLLVVLDGLSYPEMELLWENLHAADSEGRLTLTETSWAFAPLPTITEVAKPALLAGVRPVLAVQQSRLGMVSSKDAALELALKDAKAGEIHVWSLLDTDQVYHQAQSDTVGRYNAQGVLQAITARLFHLLNTAPQHLNLQIVITTDHGRLLSRSERLVSAPESMRPHGRAALGIISRDFPETGFIIENEVVLLDATRFGLSENAAIVLSDQCFRTADGKSGQEVQPHGGLFPEEVIIPFWVLHRDLNTPTLTATLSGSGEVGKIAPVILLVANPSHMDVTLLSIEIVFASGAVHRVLQNMVKTMSEQTIELLLDNFPNQNQLKSATAWLRCKLQNGIEFSTELEMRLEIREMYNQENILEDLL